MIPERKIKEAVEKYGEEHINHANVNHYFVHFEAGVQWAIEQMKFCKPSFEEVRAEFTYKGGSEQLAEEFWNHYETNNWMVGKVKMKKWTSAVAQWCARDKRNKPASKLEQNLNHIHRNMR